MSILRVVPEVRVSDLERSRLVPERTIVYLARSADLEEGPVWPTARRTSRWTAWRWAFRSRWRVVELPEPLWLRALPLTVSVGLAVRLADLLRRRHTRIVSYAKENNEPRALLRGLPRPLQWLVLQLVRLLTALIYDRFAFASVTAEVCYRASRVLPSRCETALFEDLREVCADHRETTRVPRIAFVGALERRKGVDELLSAWRRAGLGERGWELALAGSGPLAHLVLAATDADPSVVALGRLDRAGVHAVLADSAAVVLPSRREGRWREQIGLAIVEGLAHGCHVVASPDTGLAPWLRAHGHTVLGEGFDADELARALRAVAVTRLAPDAVWGSLPPVGGRLAAEDWMCEQTPGGAAGNRPTTRRGRRH